MSNTEYILRVIDFETTGIPENGIEHSVVEAAFIDFDPAEKAIRRFYQDLVVPSTPMSLEALAVHHIDEEVAINEGADCDHVFNLLDEKEANQKIIFVAHNADFEMKFFNPYNSLWIDTYKIALRLYPDAPKHTNQFLKYYLGIKDHPKHHPPHRALPDCYVTAQILSKMSEKMTFNEMIHFSKQPPYLTFMPFGKHRGKKFEDLPQDYIAWILKQPDFDEAVNCAARRVLSN